jgi:HEAT repeat protein
VYYRNRKYLAQTLGQLATVKVIPLLTELVAEAVPEDYLQIIRALGRIHHRLSISTLHLLDLNRNPYLETERACALITLGDTSGWPVLERYLRSPNNTVSQYARLTFLQQGSGEYLPLLRELSLDRDPLVASLAAGKLYLYKEDEGWDAIQRLLKSPEAQFPLALMFHYLPFQRIKGALFTLWQHGDTAVKTLAAIVFAENNVPTYLSQIESTVSRMDDNSIVEMISALRALHPPLVIPFLRKIAAHLHTEGIGDILDILLELEPTETLPFAMSLWKKAYELVHLAVADIMGKVPDPRIVTFIRQHIDRATPPVRASLAYALLVQGDESGWDHFNTLLASVRTENNRAAIERMAQLNRRESFDILIRHLSTASETLHSEILKAFGTMQLREAIPMLSKYLVNPSGKLRIAVAKALGEIGTTSARDLLTTLGKDKDEYVRVAVEIARQKSERVGEFSHPDPALIFPSIFRPANWRLSEPWFRKTFDSFLEPYSHFEPKPLSAFEGRELVDEGVLENRRETIQNDLSARLIGCSDVNVIMQAKNDAQTQSDRLMPRGAFIRSILATDLLNPDDQRINQLLKWAESGNESIHLALILASAASTAPSWLKILKAIQLNNDQPAYYDPILFSVSRKLSGSSLSLLIRMIHYDRARYYLMYVIDFLMLNPDMVSTTDIREAKEALALSRSTNLNEATLSILNTLLEHKL